MAAAVATVGIIVVFWRTTPAVDQRLVGVWSCPFTSGPLRLNADGTGFDLASPLRWWVDGDNLTLDYDVTLMERIQAIAYRGEPLQMQIIDVDSDSFVLKGTLGTDQPFTRVGTTRINTK
jgi:hypothetical protein